MTAATGMDRRSFLRLVGGGIVVCVSLARISHGGDEKAAAPCY
jgi:hypothetical protein